MNMSWTSSVQENQWPWVSMFKCIGWSTSGRQWKFYYVFCCWWWPHTMHMNFDTHQFLYLCLLSVEYVSSIRHGHSIRLPFQVQYSLFSINKSLWWKWWIENKFCIFFVGWLVDIRSSSPNKRMQRNSKKWKKQKDMTKRKLPKLVLHTHVVYARYALLNSFNSTWQ